MAINIDKIIIKTKNIYQILIAIALIYLVIMYTVGTILIILIVVPTLNNLHSYKEITQDEKVTLKKHFSKNNK